MKKIFKIGMFAVFCLACAIACFASPESATTLMLATAPITLSTQKIVFLHSLKEEYEAIDTWLNEADDLSSFVEEGQTLVFPESGSEPIVYKNKKDDVDSVEPEETTNRVELDVYDSQNYKLRNILMHALPFDKISHYTKKSADAIVKKEIADAAYTFAPINEGNKRIVIPTTGGVSAGLKMMTLEDIITLAKACDNQQYPEGRNLVLPSDMWWDLVNNTILKGQLERAPLNGVIKPTMVEYYGFKIHKSLGNKLGVSYDLQQNKKAPQGAIATDSIVPAGIVFCASEVFRAAGKFEMFWKDKSVNTDGRATEFGFQHRSKSDFQLSAQRYSGMIYQDKA